jgi:hypothetical protein
MSTFCHVLRVILESRSPDSASPKEAPNTASAYSQFWTAAPGGTRMIEHKPICCTRLVLFRDYISLYDPVHIS